uniref:Uncharacterized protein n=1 Tax=Sipha flava TaxID=143950 RepID=A0A2S2QSY2_9HEMI
MARKKKKQKTVRFCQQPFRIRNMVVCETVSNIYPILCMCKLCSTICLSVKAAYDHREKCHPKVARKKKPIPAPKSNIKTFKCECCNVVFTRSAVWKRHKLEINKPKSNESDPYEFKRQTENIKKEIATSSTDKGTDLTENQPSNGEY